MVTSGVLSHYHNTGIMIGVHKFVTSLDHQSAKNLLQSSNLISERRVGLFILREVSRGPYQTRYQAHPIVLQCLQENDCILIVSP